MRVFLHKLLFLAVLFASLELDSQAPIWNWSNAWASNGDEIGRGVFVDSAGFTYQVGSFSGSLISLPTLTTSVNTGIVGTSDIFISKIDKFGAPVWQIKAGGAGNDVAHCVTVDNNGNVYVGGYTESSACVFFGSTNISLNAASSRDFFVAKYNSSGSVLWVKTSSGSGNEEILAITCDNNYVYAGGYFTPNLTIPSLGSVSSNGGQDMLILKYDLAGNIIWAEAEGGPGTDVCTGITCDQSNVYLCGSAGNGITYAGSPNITKTAVGATGSDITLAKLDANGDVQWAVSEGNTNNCSARSISIVKNNVVVGGVYVGSMVYNTPTLTATSNNEMFFASHDRNGTFRNAWGAATVGDEVINGVTTDSRFIYVVGNFANTVNFGGTNGIATSTSNLFVACYDTLFALQFVKFGTGLSANRSLACHANQNGIVSVTGSFNGNTIQFPPLSVISPSLTEDFYVANLTNCSAVLSNTITGDQTICFGSAPSVFTVTSPTGGNGGYNYSWQQSANSVTWAPASGTNTLSLYTAPSLTQTMYYRRIVSSCASSNTSNIVTVTVTSLPTTAAAGPDQLNLCGVTTTTLAGNTAAIGTGFWTVISGAGGSFVTATNPTSTFNGLAGTSYTLHWTISNAPCTSSFDDVIITFNQNPTTAAAGPDQLNLCGVTTTTLAGNTAAIGTGSWTVISGLGGSFVSPTNPTSTFNGLAGTSYTLGWTISNAPCAASFDGVIITFNQNPTTSNAGLDQLNLCGVTTTTLAGNTAAIGTGSWTVISGLGGSFVSATNPTSTFNGLAGTTYTLRWTISNPPCTASFDNVIITFNQNPTASAAGPDQLSLCGVTSTTLAGNTAAIGTGSWTVISGAGGSFVSATNPTSIFNGLAGTTYTLHWTISNAPCTSSFDDVTITFNQNPTTAAAGPDQLNLCGVTTTTLAGNTAAIGTGSWTVISGAGGSFVSATNPTSTFNGLAGTSYTLAWTISNAPCAVSFDNVTITFNQNPTTSAAGPDQLNLCGVTTTTLAGNTAAIGTGSWTVISGAGGSFVTATNPTTNFNGLAGTTYTLRWTIINAPCTASFDDVTITFNQNPTIASAGTSQTVCASTITLSANSASIGTGSWTIISGAGGSFVSAINPTTGFNGVAGTSYTIRWTISNAPCVASFDDVTIALNQNPTLADAGVDPAVCGTVATLSANSASIGTGSWTVISGAGGNFANATNPVTVFNGVIGTTYILRWTISNAPCVASFDDVSITLNQGPTIADAGADQTVCAISTTLSANLASVGSGSWTIVSGAGGSFLSTTNPTTTFNGVAGASYTLAWTISNSTCTPSVDEVVVAFNENPSLANAGADQAACASSAVLSANTVSIGTGSWTVVSGTSGSFFNPADPGTIFNGIAGTNYILRWVISNAPCVSSSDEVTIILHQNPTVSKVGSNQTVCSKTISLIANTPLVGSGEWSRISGGGDLISINSPTVTITNMNDGLNEFVWKISNFNCPVSADTIGVLRDELPSQARAGNDEETELERITLQAETPVVGIGKWSLLSGEGIFEDDLNPKSIFTSFAEGQNYLLWTVRNGICPASSDTLIVNKRGLFIPEIITPNNDGDNDYFYINRANSVSDIKLEVLNRWGSLEYKNSNYKNEFNGKSMNGEDLADDTYFILLSIPGEKTYTGYLIIKRK